MLKLITPYSTPKQWLQALVHFCYHESLSCFFAVYILAVLVLTRYLPLPFLPRYDWLLLLCLFMQVAMVWWLKMETIDELKVICLFHILGTAMELFKVNAGSWSYPEDGYTKFMGVPLYGGFMYASVASYITQAWRRLDLQLIQLPKTWINVLIGIAIYANFFTHHYFFDIRYILLVLIVIIYWRSAIVFKVHSLQLKMPMTLSFVLVGFFIWLAENIATFFGAWQYPDQANNWKLVHPGKVLSWLLLFIVSFIIVAQLKRIKAIRQGEPF